MDLLLNRQLHLATFDDHDILNALPFHIHSIKQNHPQLAQQIFQHIMRYFAGKKALTKKSTVTSFIVIKLSQR